MIDKSIRGEIGVKKQIKKQGYSKPVNVNKSKALSLLLTNQQNVTNKITGEQIMKQKIELFKNIAGVRTLLKTEEVLISLILLSDDNLSIKGLTADKIALKLGIKETSFLNYSSKFCRMGLIKKIKTKGQNLCYDLTPMLELDIIQKL